MMPNSSLFSSEVINYFYPEKALSVPVEVGSLHDSDLEQVEVSQRKANELLASI